MPLVVERIVRGGIAADEKLADLREHGCRLDGDIVDAFVQALSVFVHGDGLICLCAIHLEMFNGLLQRLPTVSLYVCLSWYEIVIVVHRRGDKFERVLDVKRLFVEVCILEVRATVESVIIGTDEPILKSWYRRANVWIEGWRVGNDDDS